MVHTARYMVKELLVRLNRMPEVVTIKWLSVALLYKRVCLGVLHYCELHLVGVLSLVSVNIRK